MLSRIVGEHGAVLPTGRNHYPDDSDKGFQLMINPLPDDKALDWSKLKQIADDILRCI